MPRVHGRPDSEENRALACSYCNAHKAVNLAGIDPETGKVTALYNPRIQDWAEHFAMDGAAIHGRTDVGRTTARVLRMNDETRVLIRAELLEPVLD